MKSAMTCGKKNIAGREVRECNVSEVGNNAWCSRETGKSQV